MNRLGQEVGGIYYKSPIVVGSSPLTDRVELIKRAEDNGAGAVSTKLTMFRDPVKGVRRMYAERGVYTFNPSDKRNLMDRGVELVRQAKEQTDIVVWTNITGDGDDLDSWVTVAKAMEEAGADALELNFTCPNMSISGGAEGGKSVGATISKDPNLMREIVSTLKGVIKIPIWVKAKYDGTEAVANSKILEQAGADGIVVGGSSGGAPPIDVFNAGRPKLAGAVNCAHGGATGAISRPLANRNMATVTRMTKGVPLLGNGGITDYTHILERIMFGATLVSMCSKILWDGFETVKKMNGQLEKFMEDQGYQSLQDIRGIALEHLVAASDKLEYTFSVPTIDAAKCNGCGLCARIGSCTAIQVKEKLAVIDAGQCEQCGLCVSLCPQEAITY